MYRKWLMTVLGFCVVMADLYTGFWFFLSHKASQKMATYFNERLPFQTVTVKASGFPLSWHFDIKVATKDGKQDELNHIHDLRQQSMLAIRLAPMLHKGSTLKLEDHAISNETMKVNLSDGEYEWLGNLFKSQNKTIVITESWIDQVHEYSRAAKESLKAFNLPAIYRLDDSSITADFWLKEFTIMVKGSSSGMHIKSKESTLTFAHSLMSYMMSGKLIDDDLLDGVIDFNASGTINDKPYMLHLAQPSKDQMITINSEGIAAQLVNYLVPGIELDSSTISATLSHQTSIAKAMKGVTLAFAQDNKLAISSLFSDLTLNTFDVAHDGLLFAIKEMTLKPDAVKLAARLTAKEINVVDQVALFTLHDFDLDVDKNMKAHLKGVNDIAISAASWEKIARWIHNVSPDQPLDKLEKMIKDDYVFNGSVDFEYDIKSKHIHGDLDIKEFDHQGVLTIKDSKMQFDVSPDKQSFRADQVNMSLLNDQVMTHLLKNTIINPKAVVPASVVLKTFSHQVDENGNATNFQAVNYTWAGSNKVSWNTPTDLTKALSVEDWSAHVSLNMDQMWLAMNDFGVKAIESDLIPLYWYAAQDNTATFTTEINDRLRQYKAMLEANDALLDNLAKYHQLSLKIADKNRSLKAIKVKRFNADAGLTDDDIKQRMGELDALNSELNALNKISIRESNTSQVVIPLKEVYDTILSAPNANKKGVHVEGVAINDLHITEATSSTIDPMAIAIRRWLLEHGAMPIFVKANNQSWVVHDIDSTTLAQPKEVLYTTFSENMKAMFDQSTAHVTLNINHNNDGLTIDDLSVKSDDKTLLKLDALHYASPMKLTDWSALKWMPYHDNDELMVPWLSSALDIPLDAAKSPALKSYDVAITFKEIVDDMNTGLQTWLDDRLIISPTQWLNAHNDLSIDALNKTERGVSFSGISLSDHVNTMNLKEWSFISEAEQSMGVIEGDVPHDDVFGFGNLMLPATIKHDDKGLSVSQKLPEGSDRVANDWSTEQATAFIQFKESNGTFTEALMADDQKKITIQGTRNTGTQSLFALMPIGSATWESHNGRFKRFNMMDNVDFQLDGAQLIYHVKPSDQKLPEGRYGELLAQAHQEVSNQIKRDYGYPLNIEMVNDEAVLWDSVAIDVMLSANNSITDMIEGTVDLKGAVAEVSAKKAGVDQDFELDIALLNHDAEIILPLVKSSLTHFDQQYSAEAKNALKNRMGLLTDDNYACSRLSGRFHSFDDFDLTLSCQDEQSLLIKKHNHDIHVKLVGFDNQEFNMLSSAYSAATNFSTACKAADELRSRLNKELFKCFNHLIEGESNEPIHLTQNVCNTMELYSVWQACHA